MDKNNNNNNNNDKAMCWVCWDKEYKIGINFMRGGYKQYCVPCYRRERWGSDKECSDETCGPASANEGTEWWVMFGYKRPCACAIECKRKYDEWQNSRF